MLAPFIASAIFLCYSHVILCQLEEQEIQRRREEEERARRPPTPPPPVEEVVQSEINDSAAR